MAANAPVPPVVPPVQPVIPPVPPVIGNAAFIDYNSKEGNKAYERAIEPLDPPYDGSTKGVQMFIHQIKRKATICGWTNSILTIPIGNGNRPLSLLTQYGQITLQNLADHAATYMNNDCKAQQDATNLKICLDGSLDKDLMMRVLAQSASTVKSMDHQCSASS